MILNINDMVTAHLSPTGVKAARTLYPSCAPDYAGEPWRVELWKLMRVCAAAGDCWPLPLVGNRIEVEAEAEPEEPVSDFDHIEVTITRVDKDGTRHVEYDWRAASIGVTTGGSADVITIRRDKPDPGALWTPLDTALAIDAAARHRAAEAEAEIDDLAHRPGLTLADLPRLRREAAASARATCPAAPPDICATEAPRDVATEPRVEDRVTVGGWRRTVEAVEPGRILVYSGPRFYWRPEEWAFLCQMPGAVIERAPE